MQVRPRLVTSPSRRVEMSRKRRRGAGGGLSRRSLLAGGGALLAGGGLASAAETKGYEFLEGSRSTQLSTAADVDAVFSLDIQSPVQKNSRDPLLFFTNNLGETATVTLSLQTCTDGTLYDPDDGSGCTVTATILSGNTGRFDIEAAVSGVDVGFTIDVSSPSTSFSATRQTFAESGQTKSETWIKKLQGLTPREPPQNDWGIKDVKVEDVEGADNLDRVEFDVTEPNGTTVGFYTADCSDPNIDCSGGSKYQPNGNPSVSIDPVDNSYTVDASVTYTVTVTAFDGDGNSDTDTLSSNE